MLCGCWGDGWPIWCLMSDEVERDFNNVGLLCSLSTHFINLVISDNVCVGSNFLDGDIVVESS
jgi:hypothetical protein